MRVGAWMGVIALSAGVTVSGAAAQTADGDGYVTIEMNKLEPQANACRSYFVIENRTDIELTKLVLDIYIFDSDGLIERRLAMDTREILPGKTNVRLFDIRDVGCESIGRLLLNGVLECRDTSGERDDCARLLAVSSRTGVDFVD